MYGWDAVWRYQRLLAVLPHGYETANPLLVTGKEPGNVSVKLNGNKSVPHFPIIIWEVRDIL